MNLKLIDEKIPAEIKKSMLKLGFTEEKFYSESHNALAIWNDQKNSYLRKADKQTFLNALINLCKINLSLNPVKKEAYLVPRKNGDKIEVHLEASYIGLTKLLTDAGVIVNIQTNVVYDGCKYDEYFDINGVNFKHIPYHVTNSERGNIKGVYCLAFLPSGNKQFEYMASEDLNRIRGNSKTEETDWYKPPWVSWESEMSRKSCLRRIYKYLPRSTGDKTKYIDNAIKLDEIGFEATKDQFLMIESLLQTSALSEDEKCQIENELVTMTYAGAKRCINYLDANQLPPTEHMNMSQTDIKEIVQTKIELDE